MSVALICSLWFNSDSQKEIHAFSDLKLVYLDWSVPGELCGLWLIHSDRRGTAGLLLPEHPYIMWDLTHEAFVVISV